MEGQIDRALLGEHDPSWLVRARTALKHRKYERPRLQEHISKLKRAARAAAAEKVQTAAIDKRRAFLIAAEELLPAAEVERVMARAQQIAAEGVSA